MPEIHRDVLADTLEEIALLLELQGENQFKVRAYRNGADIVRSFDGDIVALAREGRLDQIEGLGEALRGKYCPIYSWGETVHNLEKWMAKI
jgi:DNA polymerase (family 10)